MPEILTVVLRQDGEIDEIAPRLLIKISLRPTARPTDRPSQETEVGQVNRLIQVRIDIAVQIHVTENGAQAQTLERSLDPEERRWCHGSKYIHCQW